MNFVPLQTKMSQLHWLLILESQYTHTKNEKKDKRFRKKKINKLENGKTEEE